ncbi:lysophospholipid acyltransferase family protein [Luteimonas sp. RIT-PG2_3]
MLQLEERLQQRYPHWFRGRRERIARPLLRTLGRWSGLAAVASFLAGHAHLRDLEFVAAALRHMQVRYDVEGGGIDRIPASGRVLIVANHPSGALDALSLLDCVGRRRQDVRIIANDMLSALAPLANLLLPVRIFGGRADPASLRAIREALAAGQCVIVFPAGEVSRMGLRGVRDGRWRKGFVQLARATDTPVLPIRILARNSMWFYGASALYKPAATVLLAREMFARRERRLRLRIGDALPLQAMAPAVALRRVRQTLYALGRDGGPSRIATPVDDAAGRVAEPLADAVDVASMQTALSDTQCLGRTVDGIEIRLLSMPGDSPLLQEIGRLRELTFRQVGEGTGRSRDLDRFDAHYDHILLWDPASQRIAGAYRVARGAPVLARHGLQGLYTASLFRYADDAVPRLAQGMELGRSFVVPDYWGSRSLDYLWQGIGAYLRRWPRVRYLYGAVSISAALPLPAREQLVAYYSHYYGARFDDAHDEGADARAAGDAGSGVGDDDGETMAVSLRPFQYFAAPPSFGTLDAETAFRVLRQNLSALGSAVPTLYKQYTELCEPGGARFLAFGVDPDFGDSIDGLIEVDLQRMQPRKRARYLQPSATTPVPASGQGGLRATANVDTDNGEVVA